MQPGQRTGPPRHFFQELFRSETVRYRRYLEREDRARRLKSQALSALTIISGLVYIIWVGFALNYDHPVLAGLFLFAEICCLALFANATIDVWRLRYMRPEGLKAERAYSVDILMPVYGEALTVVARTLKAVAAIRWHGPLSVYLLDDSEAPELRRLAERHGFHYRSRPQSGLAVEDAKAGNLSFGLEQSSGELILVLDADQVPRAEILEALAGYMRFPPVAFVQSKQIFDVPEDDPFDSQDPVFYDAVQLGFGNTDAAISCGSGVLYRRAALESIGGFARWNLVEDLTTSYELHSRGWKSFYYPYALSIGWGPKDIWDVYRQRGQWALDTLRLFVWDNPLFKRGLTWRRKLDYFVIGFSYLNSAFVFPFFFLIPVWTYLTGESILTPRELEFLLYRGVYFVTMALALRFLFRSQGPGKQFRMVLAGLFPLYAVAFFKTFLYPPGRKPAYQTNNPKKKRKRGPSPLAVVPQLTLLAANLVLPFYAVLYHTTSPRLIAVNVLISAVAIWTLFQIVTAALRRAGRNGEPPP